MSIEWKNVKVALGDLEPWEHNPRYLTDIQADRLETSIDEFGLVETIAIGPEKPFPVYNGHQRLSVLLDKHGPKYKIDARQSDRELTFDERRKLTIYLHEGATGDWNNEILGNLYDVNELLEWGFNEWKLKGLGVTEEPPDDFPSYEEELDTDYTCPKCGYEWSGSPR